MYIHHHIHIASPFCCDMNIFEILAAENAFSTLRVYLNWCKSIIHIASYSVIFCRFSVYVLQSTTDVGLKMIVKLLWSTQIHHTYCIIFLHHLPVCFPVRLTSFDILGSQDAFSTIMVYQTLLFEESDSSHSYSSPENIFRRDINSSPQFWCHSSSLL